MRIWSIMLAGTGLALGLVTPAMAGEAVASGAVLPMLGKGFSGMRMGHSGMHRGTVMHRWGPRVQGRWFAGWYAPGGWGAYRRPVVGYVLPSYWVRPTYRIGNYGSYGLPAPVDGYGWSRYYDDAVMIDRDGRVLDHRGDIDWDAHDGDGAQPGVPYDDDVTAHDGPPPPPHEYEGRFEGEARSNYGVDYDAPPYAAPPAIVHHGGPGAPVVTTTQAPGYIAGGYYYPGATTTTVVITPTVTTTSYVTEGSTHRRHGARRKCNCK